MRFKISAFCYFFLVTVLCGCALFQKRKPKTFAEICDCPEFNSSTGYRQLGKIDDSKNEIEFRYGSYGMGYNTFVVISSNKGKTQAFYYIAKEPSYSLTIRKKVESPYHKYEITDAALDTVLNKLLTGDIDKWQDPGFRNRNIADLGVIDIQYKFNGQAGNYRFQPPWAMIQDHPEIQLYRDQQKTIKIFTDLSNAVYNQHIKNRDGNSLWSNDPN
ncbi:MAG: hypothetical protein V4594_09700 [Bacteroidota bacterium]